MDQVVEQMMEILLAKVREYHLQMIVKLKANNEKLEVPRGNLLSQMDTHQASTEVNQREMMAKMDAWIKGLETCMGKSEANRENSDAVAEHQKAPNEEDAVETTGTREDQCGEYRQTVGSWNPLKR
jgi:hypothetical protein